MLYTKYVKMSRVMANIGFFTTSFSVLLFIFLTLFYVKKKVGSYRFLLIALPFLGFFFAAFEFFMHPFFHNFNTGITLFTLNPVSKASKSFQTFLLSSYTGLYSMTIALLALQFVYRYWAVFHPHLISKYFNGFNFCYSIAYTLFFGGFWTYGMQLFCQVDSLVIEVFKQEFLDCYGFVFSEHAAIATVAYDREGKVRVLNFLGTLDMTIVLLSQYSIIIYCAIVMAQGMKAKLSLVSPSVRKVHYQFFQTLLLQITVPTLTLFIPVFFLIYVPFFDIKISVPTGIFLSTFALYPAMDCFIVLYMASYYRLALRKMWEAVIRRTRREAEVVRSLELRSAFTRHSVNTTRSTDN